MAPEVRTAVTARSRPEFRLPAELLTALLGMICCQSCDPANIQASVVNRSEAPITLELPSYGTGPSDPVPAHSGAVVFKHLFEVHHPLGVRIRDARTRKLLSDRTYRGAEVDQLVNGDTITIQYP